MEPQLFVRRDANGDLVGIRQLDTYDVSYVGFDAAWEGKTAPRDGLPLGDRPLSRLQDESLRMRMGDGVADAVNGLPELMAMAGTAGQFTVGLTFVVLDQSNIVRAYGLYMMGRAVDSAQAGLRGTDRYFDRGCRGLGLDDRDLARLHAIDAIGQVAIVVTYAFPGAHEPIGGRGVVPQGTDTARVTSWAGEGVEPDLSPGRWVVKGEATRTNFFKTGLWGPKTSKRFPFIQRPRGPFRSITGDVPSSSLVPPKASLSEPFAVVKKWWGQYRIKK